MLPLSPLTFISTASSGLSAPLFCKSLRNIAVFTPVSVDIWCHPQTTTWHSWLELPKSQVQPAGLRIRWGPGRTVFPLVCPLHRWRQEGHSKTCWRWGLGSKNQHVLRLFSFVFRCRVYVWKSIKSSALCFVVTLSVSGPSWTIALYSTRLLQDSTHPYSVREQILLICTHAPRTQLGSLVFFLAQGEEMGQIW